MTAIVDLPNEPKFTIKAVSSQTGIRPVTLRSWERRHEVLTPHRSDNHYRLYSERDIAILRWLKYRVDDGLSISNAVSELRTMTRSNVWPEAIPLVPGQISGRSSAPTAQYVRQLAQALIQHDENRASDLLREVHARYNLVTAITGVIARVVEQVEDAWYNGEIRVDAKRFASAYLRGKLLSLFQAYPSRHSAPLIYIGCAPMEVNELDSLMTAVLLRSQGYRVDYLGPDISVEDLADYASYEPPALIILWANSEFTAREIRPMQALLQANRTSTSFCYTGKAFTLQPELCQEIPGMYLGDTFEQTLSQVKALLRSPQKNNKRIVKF
jgi:DNA-binding transcriptional MerR regulator